MNFFFSEKDKIFANKICAVLIVTSTYHYIYTYTDVSDIGSLIFKHSYNIIDVERK